jgi:leucyl/phenylalanyl-tRNA--protein transferase
MGLVAIGGDLHPARLLQAYRNGIFPWYSENEPVCWWSPDPRAIFELDRFHVSRRLARTIRSGQFELTVNRDFPGVIRGCAEGRADGTWITPEMIEAYEKLHQLGYAHSVEMFSDGRLAGGVYGVAIGGFFAGESMFSRRSDASKVALAHLVWRLRSRGFKLLDTQFLTPHTIRMGALEIPRRQYLARLRDAIRQPVTFI